MPLGKYYCDYCDKQFQDTPLARRRHLQSIQHQRARALWYDSLSRPPSSPLSNDRPQPEKPLCNSFIRTGFCRYGDACRYFHPKQNDQPKSQASPGIVISDAIGVSLANLPPSLMPPPEGGYPPLFFVDWGSCLCGKSIFDVNPAETVQTGKPCCRTVHSVLDRDIDFGDRCSNILHFQVPRFLNERGKRSILGPFSLPCRPVLRP